MSTKFDVVENGLRRLASRRDRIPLIDVTIVRLLSHLDGEITTRLRKALKRYALNDWSLRTLLMLQSGDHDAISMVELSVITGETRTNMTRICDALVEQGLAVRSASPAIVAACGWR
jgi:MarR family transcriptional repressor of emrRAB